MSKLKELIKRNKKIYNIIILMNMLVKSQLFNRSMKKKYPEVLQFPITTKCNARCKMCNVYKQSEKDMNLTELKKVINDPIMMKIKSVGINGGEPFLKNDLFNLVKLLMELPHLSRITIITNGFLTLRIQENMKLIYQLCKKNGIKLYISISLDGYGIIHDKVRGIPNCFEKTNKTIDVIKKNQSMYCDGYDVACTIIKQNLYYLSELDTYCKLNNINIKYRIGIENSRIGNIDIAERYSVLLDKKDRYIAAEFILKLIKRSSKIHEKFKYFSIYQYLISAKKERMLGCSWQDNGITISSNGDVYYCAVKSNKLGNILLNNGEDIFFKKNNLKHRKDIVNNYCDKCIHDYTGKPQLKNVVKFIIYLYKERYWVKSYEKKY